MGRQNGSEGRHSESKHQCMLNGVMGYFVFFRACAHSTFSRGHKIDNDGYVANLYYYIVADFFITCIFEVLLNVELYVCW